MTHNKLKLNHDKTEALITPAPKISNSTSFLDSLVVGNSTVHFSQSAKNLGVTFEMHLTLAAHVVNLIWSVNFEPCRISSICYYLSLQATKTIVFTFILSQLDYCSSLLSGCLRYLLNRLHKVQNNAAHLSSQPLWQTTLHLICAPCTGFQSTLESNKTFSLLWCNNFCWPCLLFWLFSVVLWKLW